MTAARYSDQLPQGAVDCHAHVMRRDAPLDPMRHSEPARDVTVEEYLNVLQAHGVTYGLLTAPSFYGTDNSLLLDALKKAKGRLRGTAIVDPSISEADLSVMRDAGVCGLRLNWVRRKQLPDIRSLDYQSLLSKAKNLGLHIEVYIEGELLPDVLGTINRSGARAVVDHFGNPRNAANGADCPGLDALLNALDAGNTWVKLSAPFRLRDRSATELAHQILARHGSERAVWATDWPWVGFEGRVTYQQCLDWLFEWVPDPAIRQRILVDTPHELFGFNP